MGIGEVRALRAREGVVSEQDRARFPDTNVYLPDRHAEVEPSPRWVRVKLGDEFIADSKRVMLLRGAGHLPAYCFPREDVRMERLEPAEASESGRTRWTVRAGDRVAGAAAWDPGRDDLKGYVAFVWSRMDAWFEEEEEVFVHPRDPYHRVDTLASSRHVRVELDGTVVAETHRPFLLFETGLPTRYYIPREDVRMHLLEPTETVSRCPYKGIASYWSVRLAERVSHDLVWCYPDPVPECPKVKGLLCFFNERVDLYVDGELQPKPKTPWSA
jgi:uncharacterized protein (DUF427 family)